MFLLNVSALASLTVRSRAKEFVELHDQVQVRVPLLYRSLPAHELKTSVELLDNLESFLSTFQKDLSDVSGQISYLQSRSRDIEGRLRSRRVRSYSFFLLNLSSRLKSHETTSAICYRKSKSRWRPSFLGSRFHRISSPRYLTRMSASRGSLQWQTLSDGSRPSKTANGCVPLEI